MIKKDNYILGVMLGTFLPLIGFYIFYLWKFSFFTFKEFTELLAHERTTISAMISVSLLLNAAVLTFFLQKKSDKTAKGIFFSTTIYAIIAIIYKFAM
jgi:NADH:ubiquinone oxidoreductase subunit K